MLISDRDLPTLMASGDIDIQPFDQGAVQPASVDVRLGAVLRFINRAEWDVIDPQALDGDLTRVCEPAGDGTWCLARGQFVLADTLETIRLGPNVAARLEGKSSLGRLGLMVHATAGYIDPGFQGSVTLEISNVGPAAIRLSPAMWIGQLAFTAMTSPVLRLYGSPGVGRYQGQRGPTPSQGV